ncbi:MAG TPA: Rrf2 family transcriptional regulator [Phnomibacter sp.]|nr:Rrf2 family transcriptional regulator [Phnomibacter sp.]
MLSQKAKYALQALAVLAARYEQGPVLLPAIAAEKKIPLRFLENIMHQLKQEGILQSYRGRQGGYVLLLPPGQVNLATIIRKVDGPIAMLSCVSLHFYSPCQSCDEVQCGLHRVMAEARDSILAILEGKTLLDIIDKPIETAASLLGAAKGRAD